MPGCEATGFSASCFPIAPRLLPDYSSSIFPIFPFPQASLENPHLLVETATRALGCPPGPLS